MSAPDLGPMLILLRDHVEPLPGSAALKEALSTGVRNWSRKSVPAEKGEYWYGDAAFAAWIEDLAQVDALTEDERNLLLAPRYLEWVKVAVFPESRRNGFVFSSWCCIMARVSRADSVYNAASERSVA